MPAVAKKLPVNLITDPPKLFTPELAIDLRSGDHPKPPAATEEPVGLVCRVCGCQRFSVYYTRRKKKGKVLRIKICGHCGEPKKTIEQEALGG